jgi:hypothetical protein
MPTYPLVCPPLILRICQRWKSNLKKEKKSLINEEIENTLSLSFQRVRKEKNGVLEHLSSDHDFEQAFLRIIPYPEEPIPQSGPFSDPEDYLSEFLQNYRFHAIPILYIAYLLNLQSSLLSTKDFNTIAQDRLLRPFLNKEDLTGDQVIHLFQGPDCRHNILLGLGKDHQGACPFCVDLFKKRLQEKIHLALKRDAESSSTGQNMLLAAQADPDWIPCTVLIIGGDIDEVKNQMESSESVRIVPESNVGTQGANFKAWIVGRKIEALKEHFQGKIYIGIDHEI